MAWRSWIICPCLSKFIIIPIYYIPHKSASSFFNMSYSFQLQSLWLYIPATWNMSFNYHLISGFMFFRCHLSKRLILYSLSHYLTCRAFVIVSFPDTFSNNLNRKLEGTQIFEMNEKKYKELIKKYNLRTLNGSSSKSNQYNPFSILFIGFLPGLRLTKLNCRLILNETFSISVFKWLTLYSS